MKNEKENVGGGAGRRGALPARLDGNNTCTVQTYSNSAGARVGPLQPEGHKDLVPTFASHRASKIDSRQRPTERECMAVVGAIKHFRQYAAGSTHGAVS